MSYCRFSSDNWKSDVYVYDIGCGFAMHVAGRRRLFAPVPELPMKVNIWLYKKTGAVFKGGEITYPDKYRKALATAIWRVINALNWFHRFSLKYIPLRSINLPFAGETFEDSTAKECYNRLMELRGLGYHVPQSAMDAILQQVVVEALENVPISSYGKEKQNDSN